MASALSPRASPLQYVRVRLDSAHPRSGHTALLLDGGSRGITQRIPLLFADGVVRYVARLACDALPAGDIPVEVRYALEAARGAFLVSL